MAACHDDCSAPAPRPATALVGEDAAAPRPLVFAPVPAAAGLAGSSGRATTSGPNPAEALIRGLATALRDALRHAGHRPLRARRPAGTPGRFRRAVGSARSRCSVACPTPGSTWAWTRRRSRTTSPTTVRLVGTRSYPQCCYGATSFNRAVICSARRASQRNRCVYAIAVLFAIPRSSSGCTGQHDYAEVAVAPRSSLCCLAGASCTRCAGLRWLAERRRTVAHAARQSGHDARPRTGPAARATRSSTTPRRC